MKITTTYENKKSGNGFQNAGIFLPPYYIPIAVREPPSKRGRLPPAGVGEPSSGGDAHGHRAAQPQFSSPLSFWTPVGQIPLLLSITEQRLGQPSHCLISTFCSDLCFSLCPFSDSLSKRSRCQPCACLPLTHYSQHPKYPPREASPSAGTNLSQENLLRGWGD